MNDFIVTFIKLKCSFLKNNYEILHEKIETKRNTRN